MKKMISDMKANERVMTFLGVSSRHSKISRNGKGYLEIEFYDISGSIKGYCFGGFEESKDIQRCSYAKVIGLTKLHRGRLILQVTEIRLATPGEFSMEDIYKKPTAEEVEQMMAELYQSGKGIPHLPHRS
jgi:23S rRNA maturation-related 3'-5' exoribonuclease YhaM